MSELPFPHPPLAAAGIRLRPWREADTEAVTEACSDPLVARFIPTVPVPYTEDDARSWLTSHEPNRLAGRRLELAINQASSEAVLGAIGAQIDRSALTANVGYWLTPSARGHGCATTSLRLLCAWLFETFDLSRIDLNTDVDNVGSQRVAQRCGFQKRALLRSSVRWQTGEMRDALLWSLHPGGLAQL